MCVEKTPLLFGATGDVFLLWFCSDSNSWIQIFYHTRLLELILILMANSQKLVYNLEAFLSQLLQAEYCRAHSAPFHPKSKSQLWNIWSLRLLAPSYDISLLWKAAIVYFCHRTLFLGNTHEQKVLQPDSNPLFLHNTNLQKSSELKSSLTLAECSVDSCYTAAVVL